MGYGPTKNGKQTPITPYKGSWAEQEERRRKQKPCNCPAYPFPHRSGSKACAELEAENNGPQECYHCRGTGEGSHDGARCLVCRGSGVMKSKREFDE